MTRQMMQDQAFDSTFPLQFFHIYETQVITITLAQVFKIQH
jgi:hypothetical protein